MRRVKLRQILYVTTKITIRRKDILYSSSKNTKQHRNKKVLLRECKRHTASRVASTRYAVPVGRTPPPNPDLGPGRGGRGGSSTLTSDWGAPLTRMGVPQSGFEMGLPPSRLDLVWGYPLVRRAMVPPPPPSSCELTN